MWLFKKELKSYQKEIREHAALKEGLEAKIAELRTTLETQRLKQEMVLREKEQEIELSYKKKEQDLDVKLEEIKHLHRMEIEESETRLKNKYEKKLNDMKVDNAEKFTNEKQRMMEDYHKKLDEELTKLHSTGNHQTTFVKDLALKMMEESPSLRIEQIKRSTDGTKDN